ncbi:hemerythrin [Desulfuromonas versatilis]|uniref:Hemerythrin n=1 Tax=Desulfuromonas versatilis TaxID=2802975 RepID=A0ABM9SDD8_9BACT|nr:bacteriohemerythrin [Desulfuromonas versatilis]BCR03090.1 hemerythrin [Desulfuromonas versatilis]
MALQWKAEYSVGVEIIDAQHQELFRRFGALTEACKQARGKEQLAELLDFLSDYIVFHFNDEESQMLRYGYPGFAGHREEHRSFMGRIEALRKQLAEGGSSFPLLVETNEAVLRWLIMHIRKVDTAFGEYLQGRS